jgi:hypothetical protein
LLAKAGEPIFFAIRPAPLVLPKNAGIARSSDHLGCDD